MKEINEDITSVFLGSLYGFQAGYDGSVFDKEGVAKTLVASTGGIIHVIDIVRLDDGRH